MLDFLIFAATAVIGLLIIFFWIGWGSDEGKPQGSQKAIPRWNAPPADAELGDLGELAKHGSLHQYLLHLHENGNVPITSFWWAKTRVVSVCNPQAFKELVGLVNRPVLLFKMIEPLIGSASIQYANDEDWDQRQKCLYKTLKGEELKSYFPTFVTIAKEAEEKWMRYSPSDHVPLMKEVFPLTIKGITRTCMGNVFADDVELDRLSAAYHNCWREIEDRLSLGEPKEGSERVKKFEKNKEIMVDSVLRIVRTRREGGGQGQSEELPFIDSMLQNYPSEDKIVSDVLSFLVGGFHTSGYLMTWLLWYLANNPASQNRLHEEVVKEVGGDYGERLKAYALRTDTFMRQVEDETLRLSTLALFAARYSDKEVVVCGHRVPAKTPIITALGVALKNTTQWQDEEKWDPDRFAADGRHGKRGNEFCPFGIHSRRKCPGYLFSYFEVSIFVAVLLQRFEVVPVPGQDATQVHGLVTEPKDELFVQLNQRE